MHVIYFDNVAIVHFNGKKNTYSIVLQVSSSTCTRVTFAWLV